jgi:arylsulfatase A-like enzyme
MRVIMAILAMVLSGSVLADAAPPNVVFVLVDDPSPAVIQTMPSLQNLASKSADYSRAFASTPLCQPSRASIQTGDYAHHTGVWRNLAVYYDGWSQQFEPGTTLAQWMHPTHATAFFGKYANGFTCDEPRPPGWDMWEPFCADSVDHGLYYDYSVVVNGTVEAHGEAPSDYSTEYLGGHARAFVQSALARATPFFVMFAPFASHAVNHETIDIAPQNVGAFGGVAPWRPLSYEPPLALMGGKAHWEYELFGTLNDEANAIIDRYHEGQLEAMLSVTQTLHAIIKEIRLAGQMANTIIVFAGDNGYALGEQWWVGKVAPTVAAKNIPLLIRWDGHIPPEVVTTPAMNIDIAPTIAGLAGVDIPVPVDGMNLFNADFTNRARDHGLIEWIGGSSQLVGTQDNDAADGDVDYVPPYLGVVTATDDYWKFYDQVGPEVVGAGTDAGFTEHYNVATDPGEFHNLALDPADAPTLARFDVVVNRLYKP